MAKKDESQIKIIPSQKLKIAEQVVEVLPSATPQQAAEKTAVNAVQVNLREGIEATHENKAQRGRGIDTISPTAISPFTSSTF